MTRRLILMRHAKSDWRFDLDDHDRPLNARGVKSARALGLWLRAQGYAPDVALVSTAVRTRETFGLLGLSIPAQFMSGLYHADPAALHAAASGCDADTALIVAHNPGICAYAHQLVEAPPDHDRWNDYPTGATLVVRFEGASDDRGRAEAFIVPRDLPDLPAAS